MPLAELIAEVRQAAHPQDAVFLQRFFKTGKGEYGEGDVFLGIRVPVLRKLVRKTDALSLTDLRNLLHSQYHEERLLALLSLVRRFERSEPQVREKIYQLYLGETRFINNWDLVDLSAPNIVGAWLADKPRKILYDLAKSASLWERRIAILATFRFIRSKDYQDAVSICVILQTDRHDLIHKACGWMLREVGKRDVSTLRDYLQQHVQQMPRTMLRYAIERLPEAERRRWMAK